MIYNYIIAALLFVSSLIATILNIFWLFETDRFSIYSALELCSLI